ncbi:Protein of unknown function [Cribrihabitans marinus]|uniref:DUF4239 domain-containing protein n=2 Tax=Cribrihabitans marinus TaxID=1227549 RepID=A0A1H7E6N2_9RHOB|nr:hypothetical protein [Cribrihabitans marinus]SEK07732.1 Protein of unknown function [Cribrihabitans marinus]
MNETFLAAIVIIASTVVVALLFYRVSHWLVGPKPETASKELSGSILGRVSALHALILGLVFAQLALDYRVLQKDLGSEADTVIQIVTDARLHGGEGADGIISGTKDYVDAVVNHEWQDFASAKAEGSAGRVAWLKIYKQTLNLNSETAVQKMLHDNLVAKARALETLRNKRLNIAGGSNQIAFWFAAIAGLVIISVSYFAFAPSGVNLAFVSLFGAYNGITLFLIYALVNPYVAPGAIQPDVLIHASSLIGQ